MSDPAEEARPHAARPWATERDWVQHRKLITELYKDKGMTLRKVMEEMRDRHQFYGTEKMYKARFGKWAIRKNLNRTIAEQKIVQHVAVLVSGETSGKDADGANPAEAERLTRYLRRLSPEQYQKMQESMALKAQESMALKAQESMALKAQESMALKAVESMGRRDVPKENNRWHGLPDMPSFPLTKAPESGSNPENCMRILSNYINGSIELQIWDMTFDYSWDSEIFEPQKRSSGWSGLMQSAAVLLRDGYMDYAFGIMNFCFDQCQYVLRSEDPWMFPFVFRAAFEIARSHPRLYQSLLRYLDQLSSIIHGPRHPFSLVVKELRQMGTEQTLELDRYLAVAYVDLMRAALESKGPVNEDLFVQGVMGAWVGPKKQEQPKPAVTSLSKNLKNAPHRWFHVDPDLQCFEHISSEDWAVLFQASRRVYPVVRWIVRSSTRGLNETQVETLEALVFCEVALQKCEGFNNVIPAGYNSLLTQFMDSVDDICIRYPLTGRKKKCLAFGRHVVL